MIMNTGFPFRPVCLRDIHPKSPPIKGILFQSFGKHWWKGMKVLGICFASLMSFGQVANEKVLISPPSGWIETRDWDRGELDSKAGVDEGMRYLLIDLQRHTVHEESYRHYVQQMVNERGVQENGTLSFSFDPSYQELILHRVLVHRDSKSINQLDRSELKIIQPEENLAWNVYSGEHSATLFIKDLRVGDVLEFDYTLRGRNPIFKNHFYTRFYLQYTRPIHEQFYRLVLPQANNLQERYHDADWPPVIMAGEEYLDYRWEIPTQPALLLEDYLPYQFDPYIYMEFSDHATWGDVVGWALPLYRDVTDNLSEEMRELTNRWLEEHKTKEARALAALQFVQDELRYMGIEFGPNSHQPSAPSETLERRFGDCKDKAYLLCTLLRSMDLDAWPALVNTYDRELLAEHLPSPLAFNHMIVKLQLGDQVVWMDPTISHQGGELDHRFIPPYGLALVVQPGVNDLEPIVQARTNEPDKAVQETFTVASYDSPVKFRVVTVNRREDADMMRQTLADMDREQLAKEYLNFYSRLFEGVKQVKPLEIVDDTKTNVLKVIEHYEINDFWELSEDGNQWTVTFYPHSLETVMTDPSTRLRKMPLHITYPLHQSHNFSIHLHDEWDVKNDSQSIKHEAFELDIKQRMEGQTIHFEYELKTHIDQVPPDQVEGYLKKLAEMEDNLGNYLYRASEAATEFSLGNLNWIVVIVALGYSVLLLIGLIWVCLTPRFRPIPGHLASEPPLVSPTTSGLQGLGGWLVLVGIGVTLNPVVMMYDVASLAGTYFSNWYWHEYAMPQGGGYHPLFGPVIIFELLGNITFAGMSVVMVYLFYAKRMLFPKFYIVFALSFLVFLVLDEILCRQISTLNFEGDTEGIKAIVRSIVQCLVWIPYMLVSKRVKLTFVR